MKNLNRPQLNSQLLAFSKEFLEPIGILDVGYSRWNVVNHTHLFVCSLDQFVTDVYYKHDCDIVAAGLLEEGAVVIPDSHPIKVEYDKLKGVPCTEHLIINRTPYGFDEFVVTSDHILNEKEFTYLRRKMAQVVNMFADEIGHPTRNRDAAKAQHTAKGVQLPAELSNSIYTFGPYAFNYEEMVALYDMYFYNRQRALSCPKLQHIKTMLGSVDMSTARLIELLGAHGILKSLEGFQQ